MEKTHNNFQADDFFDVAKGNVHVVDDEETIPGDSLDSGMLFKKLSTPLNKPSNRRFGKSSSKFENVIVLSTEAFQRGIKMAIVSFGLITLLMFMFPLGRLIFEIVRWFWNKVGYLF